MTLFSDISRPVNGFICFICAASISVCNPTTRQIVKLPKVRLETVGLPKGRPFGYGKQKKEELDGRDMYARLGYDPVEDQYKVLCVMIDVGYYNRVVEQEHFVCTVRSSEKREWRKIENTTRGGVDHYDDAEMIRLWILEDAEKQEWSSMTFDFSSGWATSLLGTYVLSEGVTHTGELMVFHPPCLKSCKPFWVFFCDLNRESVRKVEVQGMEKADLGRNRYGQLLGYPGHVENIRFL
ncbi:unnamed protein product [Thlaspi arvense]|uniref:F-box associated beta-propeller type 3 domain-containing protein n=1 Tax=Thlaspi arvense TaxID=13288 RepID=A0AAU9STM6_THLAR|nr:unnamed protein product [Thlaspi arvense]